MRSGIDASIGRSRLAKLGQSSLSFQRRDLDTYDAEYMYRIVMGPREQSGTCQLNCSTANLLLSMSYPRGHTRGTHCKKWNPYGSISFNSCNIVENVESLHKSGALSRTRKSHGMVDRQSTSSYHWSVTLTPILRQTLQKWQS